MAEIRLLEVSRHIREICAAVTFCKVFFLRARAGRRAQSILKSYTSVDADSRKKVPLGVPS
jgi:hypothetical protein